MTTALGQVQRAMCSGCHLFDVCFPAGLTDLEVTLFDSIVERYTLKPGQSLYDVGDPGDGIYVVRTGSVKAFTPSPGDGSSEVLTGIYLPSECIGVDGIALGANPSSVKALETTTVCGIPASKLKDLTKMVPSVGVCVFEMLAQKICMDHEQLELRGKPTAAARMAALLLSFSARMKRLGFCEHEFNLSVSRYDIGNYLCLAPETVSRILSDFKQKGLVQIERRHVILKDVPTLRRLAGK